MKDEDALKVLEKVRQDLKSNGYLVKVCCKDLNLMLNIGKIIPTTDRPSQTLSLIVTHELISDSDNPNVLKQRIMKEVKIFYFKKTNKMKHKLPLPEIDTVIIGNTLNIKILTLLNRFSNP